MENPSSGSRTSYPDQAWRLEAACLYEDPDLFDWKGPEDLGLYQNSTTSVRRLNEERFALAKQSCAWCPVLAECEADAIRTDAHVWGVRGGLSPYDRPDVKPGYLEVTQETLDAEAAEARERLWNHYLSGSPQTDLTRGDKVLLSAAKAQYADEHPQDAEWWAHKIKGAHRVAPGTGWALSQDRTMSVVKVMFPRPNGGLGYRLVNSINLAYDRDITPKVLIEWSDGIDLPHTR